MVRDTMASGEGMGALIVAGWLAMGCSGPASHVQPDHSTAAAPDPPVIVALRLEDAAEEGPSDKPRTRARLVEIDPDRGRSDRQVGVFDGACTLVAPPRGILLLARCWWADETARIEVVRDGNSIVARVHDQAGLVREAARLELRAEARLDVMGPTPVP